MKESKTHPKSTDEQPANEDKRPYETPLLKEHGSAKDITLQTFFGTFSPPASD